jgi:hypothetical protein
VSHFNYLGCDVSYNYDADLQIKLNKFQYIDYRSLAYNVSTLYIRDASCVSVRLVYGPAMVMMTSHISAVGNIRLLVHQQGIHSNQNTPVCKPHHKQVIRSLFRDQGKWAYSCACSVRQTITSVFLKIS